MNPLPGYPLAYTIGGFYGYGYRFGKECFFRFVRWIKEVGLFLTRIFMGHLSPRLPHDQAIPFPYPSSFDQLQIGNDQGIQ